MAINRKYIYLSKVYDPDLQASWKFPKNVNPRPPPPTHTRNLNQKIYQHKYLPIYMILKLANLLRGNISYVLSRKLINLLILWSNYTLDPQGSRSVSFVLLFRTLGIWAWGVKVKVEAGISLSIAWGWGVGRGCAPKRNFSPQFLITSTKLFIYLTDSNKDSRIESVIPALTLPRFPFSFPPPPPPVPLSMLKAWEFWLFF